MGWIKTCGFFYTYNSVNTEITELLRMPGWEIMWLLAASIFVGAKWLTVADAGLRSGLPRGRVGAYLLLWPGLDFRGFVSDTRPARPSFAEWFMAVANMAFGAAIVWGGVRLVPSRYPLLTGWVGMVGIVFVLHFGIFHLFSNVWRAAGVNAPPLMANPIGATSLAGFWGGKWNKAFNDLMAPHVFAPIARRFGTTVAVFAVFLVSGLLHEIVISLPAWGGFGLPTLYFAIQGAGLLLERSAYGRKFGLGRGFRGWAFTAIVTGGPAFWLFHPIFVRHVILPMLRAIGAL